LEAELASQLAEELAQELRHRASPRSQLSKASTPKSPAPARDAPTSARARPPTGAAGRGLQALQDQVPAPQSSQRTCLARPLCSAPARTLRPGTERVWPRPQVRLCRNTLTLQFKKANPRKDGRINKEQLLASAPACAAAPHSPAGRTTPRGRSPSRRAAEPTPARPRGQAALRAVEVKTSRDAVDALLALVPVDAQVPLPPPLPRDACSRPTHLWAHVL